MKREKVWRAVVEWLFIAGLGYIGAVGQLVYAADQLPPYVAGQQGPTGGMGGERCSASDVPPEWQLTSINVRSGDWIDAIDLTFYAPGAPELPAPIHCGGTGGSPGRILIIDEGEFIVRVMGKYVNVLMPDGFGGVVSYLYVQTSKGKTREFGNARARGVFFDYIAPDGTAIAGFIIRAHTYVDAIGVILRTRP